MDINFFKKIKFLDGGVGQELLSRGMQTEGTLWSANALLHEKYHQLLLDIHLDYINAGAQVIITNTFTTRRLRLRDNNIEDKFEYLNIKAGEIAKKAKDIHPHVLIGGGIPPQYLTYEVDTREDEEIKQNFYDQAKCLNPFVDFFYFDVFCSVREFSLAIQAIEEFDKPYLIGAHISEGNTLPSKEKLSDIITKIEHKKLLGVILACVSPENYEKNSQDLKNLEVPFGFKLNAFVTTKPTQGYTSTFRTTKTGNPNEFLGQRKDLNPKKMSLLAKKFKDCGATILGGCCETNPQHIKELRKIC